jgi:hypothetical protein
MANMRFQRRIPESTFECRWTIQYVTTDPRWCRNSRSITSLDFRTNHICQT